MGTKNINKAKLGNDNIIKQKRRNLLNVIGNGWVSVKQRNNCPEIYRK